MNSNPKEQVARGASSKLAHQFWFSSSGYIPPGAGGSSNSKSAQTDEEKQRERQRNEREQQNAQLEAQNIKRERDAREARQLDLEIRRQQEREARQAAHLESARKKEHDNQKLQNQNQQSSSQVHTQLPQQASVKGVERGTTPRATASCERTLPADLKPSKSHERKSQTPPDRTASSSAPDHTGTDRRVHQDGKSDYLTSGSKERTSTTPSPQTVTAAPTHVAAATIPAAAASIGIIAALRDDSTESDQSITYSQSQSETIHRLM
ncbi:uncharacterized protein LOC129786966 [Lutzomyia longipalpis]|uniref:uncharacterized protein LOC129786966 n=1 Tax=Lutzomyia longipalpis TaxID=7200 RepID=UPI002483A3C9|nr:uncharacterized protein LOC129786966 [Lutzomyia longipalpis]